MLGYGACKDEWINDPDKRCSNDTLGKVEDDCQIECGVCSGNSSYCIDP